MKKRLLILCMIVAALTGAFLIPGAPETVNTVFHQHEHWPAEQEGSTGLDEQGVLTSHLPILILHVNGTEVPGTVREDIRTLLCSYTLVWNETGVNRSDDPPTQMGQMELSIRGNSSRNFPKKQYSMKLVDREGLPQAESLLGMPEETSWVLNGSYIDHSLIRNYMLYNLCGEITGGYVPRCRLCEVMVTDKQGEPVYQGVYTLIEKPKVSQNRVDLTEYDPKYTETSFLVQMNSHIDTYEIQHLQPKEIPTYSYDLEYPNIEELTLESVQYIQHQLLILEKMLYDADITGDWSDVEERIDLESFVDYYLINEFFQNYDAGMRSTYIYQNVGGKFCIGPVWDFDGAFNNYGSKDFDRDLMEMQTSFFFYYLVRDPNFITQCTLRYRQLREGMLSDSFLKQYIDECSDYLGSATEREMAAWHWGKTAASISDREEMKQFAAERGACLDEYFSRYSLITE